MERGLDAVGRLVYRTLLRTAKEFDKHSVLKALITRQHLNELPAEVQQVASAFLGGPDRVFFWPAPTLPQSVVTAVQMGFRFPPSAVNLDAAFSAMRYLQGLTSIGRKHGLLGVLPNGESVGLQQLSIPEPGALLIPHPLLPGFFERAVVLLLQHSPMQGSLGLCLNRPIAGDSKTLADVAELAPFIQADQSASTPDDPAMHSMASMADDDWSDAEDEEGEQMLPLREAVRMILAPAGQEAASTKEADEADVDDLMDRSIVVEYILSPVEREDEDSVFRRGRGSSEAAGQAPQQTAVSPSVHTTAEIMEAFTDSPVFIGGPCHGLQVLHSSEELQQASPAHGVPLSQLYNVPLYAGADLQRGKELLSQGRLAPGDVRFFLGEAQWEGGQLERELAEGSWLLAPLPAPLTALLDLIPPDRPEVARRTMPDGLPQSSDTLWSIMMTSLSPEHAQLMHIVPAVRKDLAEMEF
ncbi:hypothetical protein WJX72_011498 [[Myrmecia] bisecta]|uniref:Uncharacterized protein n=1 Tax=[Myrmecia] bisecta TaxID=41462 RepID=A0AAW1PMB5_9CHLO